MARPRPTSAEIWDKTKLPLFLLVCLALVVPAILMYTSERRTTRQSLMVMTAEEIAALDRRSVEFENRFEAIRQRSFEVSEEDLRLLEEALRLREEYISAARQVGTNDERQRSLRRRLHLQRAEKLRLESTRLEEAATAEAKTNEGAAALLLKRAVECEREIEAKWTYADLADPGRRARLETRQRRWESAELWQRGRTQEATAEGHFLAGRFAESVRSFQGAIDSEVEFVGRYRDVRNTEFERVDKLIARRETAKSGQAWDGIRGLRAKAESVEQAEDWPAATLAWQEVVQAMARLRTEYPQSSFADRETEQLATTRLNAARFHGEILRAGKQLAQLRVMLRTRQVDDGVRLIGEILPQLRRLAEAGTGQFGEADPRRQEIEYLGLHIAVLRSLLPAIDRELIALPADAVRMYRTEIPQGLYASVMGTNPSAQRREGNPVESVTHGEAEAFAQRLGWLIGARARLPTAAEYQAVLGPAGLPRPAAEAWTAENSEPGAIRPVGQSSAGPHGLHDLIGNVAEWTQATAGESRAPVIGGSVSEARSKDLPLRLISRREKSRTLGFRVVVE